VKASPTTVAVRCPAELLIKLDGWRRAQADVPTRAIAIRRLAEHVLADTSTTRQRSRASTRKAAEMAASAIGDLGDQTASSEERAHRKRRLIKGPQEFRGLRRGKSRTKDRP
jgi:hypothetical protein